jgi:hypothetical protein
MRMDAATISAKLAAQAAGRALLTAGIPGGELAVEQLLSNVLHIQDEQSAALNRIDAGVQLLLDNPWNTAWQYIREAAVPHAGPAARRSRLERAAERLHEAIPNQPPRSFRRAFACLDLALVEHILGDTEFAALHARDAADCAIAYMQDVASGTVEPPHATARTLLRGAQRSLRATASYIGYPTQASLLRDVDRRTNEWLRSLYHELGSVCNAAALLLGDQRKQILDAVAAAPLDLASRNGQIEYGARVWASQSPVAAAGAGARQGADTSKKRDGHRLARQGE